MRGECRFTWAAPQLWQASIWVIASRETWTCLVTMLTRIGTSCACFPRIEREPITPEVRVDRLDHAALHDTLSPDVARFPKRHAGRVFDVHDTLVLPALARGSVTIRTRGVELELPELVARAGDRAAEASFEFFTAHIPNAHRACEQARLLFEMTAAMTWWRCATGHCSA